MSHVIPPKVFKMVSASEAVVTAVTEALSVCDDYAGVVAHLRGKKIDEVDLHRHAGAVRKALDNAGGGSGRESPFVQALAGLTEPRAPPKPAPPSSGTTTEPPQAWVSAHEAPWLQLAEASGSGGSEETAHAGETPQNLSENAAKFIRNSIADLT